MNRFTQKSGEKAKAKQMTDDQLRQAAHDRVWEQTDQQFEPLKSVTKEGADDDKPGQG